nr:hypothetical protein [Cupriavidus pauculus]
MFDIRLVSYGKARCLDAPNAELHTIKRHNFSGLPVEMIDKLPKTKNARRDVSFELGTSRKDHNLFDAIGRQKVKQLADGTNVPSILIDGVLKLKARLEQNLSPLRSLAVREDPAIVVLCLYDKDAEP